MIRFLVVTAIVVALTAGTALAKEGDGARAVKKANDTVAELLKKKAAPGSAEEKALASQVTASVREFLDVDELGRRALVDHWPKLSAGEKAEFLALLRALIEDNYVKGLRANLDYQVSYGAESAGKDGAVVVKTEIKTQRRGRPLAIAVDYVLVAHSGKLRCVDVVTDGVGLVANYRTQFNKIIDKDGFAGLINRMKKKRQSG